MMISGCSNGSLTSANKILSNFNSADSTAPERSGNSPPPPPAPFKNSFRNVLLFQGVLSRDPDKENILGLRSYWRECGMRREGAL